MRPILLTRTLPWLFGAALAVTGCAIEEAPDDSGADPGSILVTARDEADAPIIGASIAVDGVPRAERTPALVHRVAAGSRQVVVRYLGRLDDEVRIVVSGGDTAEVDAELNLPSADQLGRLTVASVPSGARLLLDGRDWMPDGSSLVAPASIDLPPGAYDVSVQLDGYATVAPILSRIQVAAGSALNLSFTLESTPTALAEGSLPPDFRLETVDGDTIRLTDLTGYPVLVNFWYADCQPCKDEFPGIEAVYEQYADRGFRVLGVNPMYPDTREDVRRIQENFNLTFHLLLDWDHSITAQDYRVSAFPRNVLVDRSGRIHALRNRVEEDELRTLVEELIDRP